MLTLKEFTTSAREALKNVREGEEKRVAKEAAKVEAAKEKEKRREERRAAKLAAKDKELASLRDGDDSITAEGATGAAVETDESESLRAQMAAKDAELARVKAELASLRALLPPPAPSEEDVPPSS